ncbi:MAG: hypothetical protein JO076_04030 [Verrucomicrobia bacterium]|nr:hypothetical protein [Verrucomicrobiota bacterium]
MAVNKSSSRKSTTDKEEEKFLDEQTDADAASRAGSAADAKADELRNALQAKCEQGKTGLGLVPIEDDLP